MLAIEWCHYLLAMEDDKYKYRIGFYTLQGFFKNKFS